MFSLPTEDLLVGGEIVTEALFPGSWVVVVVVVVVVVEYGNIESESKKKEKNCLQACYIWYNLSVH